MGTLNLLEACRNLKKTPRFIFASSNAPLGRQKPPATEDKAPLPVSPYGASKRAGEAYCLAYHGSWDVGTVALRFSNVYGPFSAHKNSVVGQFFKDIITKDGITIDGDGKQTRDFIHVEDLCRAIVMALESEISGQVFQIGTGVETSILELATRIRHVVNSSFTMNHGRGRQGDIRRNYSAIKNAQSALQWRPQIGLESGLRDTWEWFKGWDAR